VAVAAHSAILVEEVINVSLLVQMGCCSRFSIE